MANGMKAMKWQQKITSNGNIKSAEERISSGNQHENSENGMWRKWRMARQHQQQRVIEKKSTSMAAYGVIAKAAAKSISERKKSERKQSKSAWHGEERK